MHFRASLREPYMLFGTTRFSKGKRGQVGGGTRTEHITEPALMHLRLYILNSMKLLNTAVATIPALRG